MIFNLLSKVFCLFLRVSSGNSFPPPLPADEEERLFSASRKGDKKARELLIEHNLRLVAYISKRFENTGASIEELISIGTVGLIKAISTFNSDKNIKLATYASRCIENEILMFLRKKSKMKIEVSLDEPLKMDYDGNELLLSDVLGSDPNEINENIIMDEKKEALYKAIEGLKQREKLILKMRFGLYDTEEMTQKDVADTLGISQSYISRLEKRIIKKLQNKLTK